MIPTGWPRWLRYVEADEPGYRRRRCGRGFSYLDGDVVFSPPERDRLAVPPAWSDVWLCRDDVGYIQATGTDDAGRKQYRYHRAFRDARDRQQFDRLAYFARALIPIRRQVSAWLDHEVGSRDHAVGAALRLIDTGLLRIGNRESAGDGRRPGSAARDPRVLDVTEAELTEIWNRSRRSSWRSRGDSALAKLRRPA